MPVALASIAGACDRTNPDDFHKAVEAGPDCDADLTKPEGFADAVKCAEYKSCAFDCADGCNEVEKPYACPAMRGWAAMPHAAACGAYDGNDATHPAVVQGQCIATAPQSDAVLGAGIDPTVAGRVHLPDGHFIQPAGREELLRADGVTSGFPLNVLLVPGTHLAVVSDSGVDDNALYTVDLDALAKGDEALVDHVAFPAPNQVEYGLAFVAPNLIYVSGGARGYVYAFVIDTTTGKLTAAPPGDLDLGVGTTPSISHRYYSGGIANGPSSQLVVAPETFEPALRVAAPRATTGIEVTGSIDLGGPTQIFDVVADPFDPTSDTFWVTALDTHELLRIDLANKKVAARISTAKNPEGAAPIEGKFVAVAASDDDALQLFDATSGALVQAVSFSIDGRTGAQPGLVTYDAPRKRLYVTLSGQNALAVMNVDATSKTAPLTYLGRVPTGWWPTQVRVRDDGSLVVLAGKGHGTGPADAPYGFDQGETPELTHGSIAVVPLPSDADVSGPMEALVARSRDTSSAHGWPTVSCPAGAPYDFPVPLTNTGAASAQIQHVVYVVRENKTFDSLFGDMPGVDGDPRLVMAPGKMDDYWKNARTIARDFTVFDQYYTSAEQSLQGHIWNSFGRETDFIERTWMTVWGRGVRQPKAGIDPQIGSPREGSLFAWAEANAVDYDDMGEIVGVAKKGFDPHYPGLVITIGAPDLDKACYVAARARATCDLKAFTYVVLPNDHTQGLSAGAPTPELMISVNDEATGMLLDSLSHSPIWPSTLFIVTEDDPQSGGDHVDAHRTPLFMASPWIKRGYVAKSHVDVSSIAKLLAHVFAKPYPSQVVADAALPLDAFTSTPDYTPYTYTPRTTATSCNPSGTKDAEIAAGWSFDDPDDQPGLSEQVRAHMRRLGDVDSVVRSGPEARPSNVGKVRPVVTR